MKIDVFSHIWPEKYFAAMQKKMPSIADFREAKHAANVNVKARINYMNRYPDVLHVLTVSLPPLETLFKPADAIKLAKIANDELAELVENYPDKFIAGVACLPLNNIDAALAEADRAITQLGLKGIQMFTNINGESLDLPKFRPLYEKMAYHDLPIWIHPWIDRNKDANVFVFDYELALAMFQLVSSGVFQDYPDLKILVHHCGGILPLFDGRISWLRPEIRRKGQVIKTLDHLRKFYVDTAVSGSTSALMCAYDFYGIDKMLFASDVPLGPKPAGITLKTIRSVERMPIPDIEKGKIFEQNAIDLLKLMI
jgi:predicted TIM-barrel fold metal-dependent hydrolase